jgi:hypothetical protein
VNHGLTIARKEIVDGVRVGLTFTRALANQSCSGLRSVLRGSTSFGLVP